MTETLKIEMWRVLGFHSKEEYQEYLAQEKESPTRRERPSSAWEYQKAAARMQGFETPYKQKLFQLRQRGFPSVNKHRQHIAKEKFAIKKGFKSYADYEEHLVKESIRTIEEQEYIAKNILCSSVENVISKIKDPESMFHDKEFIKRVTTLNKKLSCDINIQNI